jgi:hypothetical protein
LGTAPAASGRPVGARFVKTKKWEDDAIFLCIYQKPGCGSGPTSIGIFSQSEPDPSYNSTYEINFFSSNFSESKLKFKAKIFHKYL